MLDNAVLHGNYLTDIPSNSQNNIWYCSCPLLPPEFEGKYLLLKTPHTHRQCSAEASWTQPGALCPQDWLSRFSMLLSKLSKEKSNARWSNTESFNFIPTFKQFLTQWGLPLQVHPLPYSSSISSASSFVLPFSAGKLFGSIYWSMFTVNVLPGFSFIWWYIDCLLPAGGYLQWINHFYVDSSLLLALKRGGILPPGCCWLLMWSAVIYAISPCR